MNHFTKSLQISSILSALVLGAAVAAGCTVTTTPVDATPDASPSPIPTADGGSDAAPAPSGCDFGEPNDTRETAKSITLGTTYSNLCVSNPDHADELDFFELTAPASDLAGGYVEVKLSNVQNAGLGEIIVTSSLDNGVIFDSYTTDPGANVSGWLTVAPGAKYRIQVNRFGGAGARFSYDLSTKYTATTDTYEPNNKKEDAKSIALNTVIDASAAASSAKAELAVGDDQDWFKVTLAAGTATIKMTNNGSDFLCDVELIDATGTGVDERYQTSPGADCIIDAKELVGGSYFVKVHSFAGLPIRGAGDKPVASFVTQNYKLEVQQ
ncbi:MAG TPA: hypothetical protein VLT33_11170 [Labilithrix sp.]|nr:hypothetical protein [Labilithrix sp.]